jgi:hypothetical protein
MTATPIKTLLLNSIKGVVVSVIGEAERVFIDPSRGLREELSDPYANIFTNAESSSKKDLYTEKIFDMEVHTWVKEDTDDKAREKAILISAQIQQAVLPRSSATRTYCQYIEESAGNCFDVLYYAEGLCVVISRYNVKYRHAYGNPFSINP